MISNIDEIKAAANIVDIISEHVQLKPQGHDMVGRCPFHEEKTPSFKVHKTQGFYKCFGCGKSGDAISFLQEYKNINYIEAIKIIAAKYNIEISETTRKQYEKPIPRIQVPADNVIQYFVKRNISAGTIRHFNITEAVEWMPKAQKEIPVICFNYYRSGELINIKFRGKDKDFKLSKNAEQIFYNLDAIENENEIIIVEGEVDAMSCHEAGIRNVISVPNGTPPANSQLNLEYLNNCWKLFEGKTKIIIATDNDTPGKALRDELARRLGYDRCYMIDYPKDCKDANEILIHHGKQGLLHIISEARKWPIKGVLTMDDLYPLVAEYYEIGYPKGYKAGIGEFDEYLQFSGGQMTVITGIPNSGKSEFVDWLCTSLARNHNWKFAILSFENPAAIHVTKLMEKFIGLSFNFRKDPNHRMTRQQFEEGIYLTDLYFSFIDITQTDVTIEGILSKCKELILRTGIKGIIIDPWNYIEHKIPIGYTETQYISEALSLIKDFALRNDVHIFIIAHPKKMQKDQRGKYPVPTMYDISGSAHFFNKTDNGISVHRDFENNIVDIHIQKVRFSWLGKLGFATYSYDTFTRKYLHT